jgi:hypothetical protein
MCVKSVPVQKRTPDLNWRSGLEEKDRCHGRDERFSVYLWEVLGFKAKDAKLLLKSMCCRAHFSLWNFLQLIFYFDFFRSCYNRIKQDSHTQRIVVNE